MCETDGDRRHGKAKKGTVMRGARPKSRHPLYDDMTRLLRNTTKQLSNGGAEIAVGDCAIRVAQYLAEGRDGMASEGGLTRKSAAITWLAERVPELLTMASDQLVALITEAMAGGGQEITDPADVSEVGPGAERRRRLLNVRKMLVHAQQLLLQAQDLLSRLPQPPDQAALPPDRPGEGSAQAGSEPMVAVCGFGV